MKCLDAAIENIYKVCLDKNDSNSDNEKLNINIPFYQRPYRWSEKNIGYLFEDFDIFEKEKKQKQNSNKENNQYFTGSVVLVKKEEFYEVVDGQQRMTTLFLINYVKFLLMRGYIEELARLARTSSIERQLDEIENCYKKLLGTRNVVKIHKANEELKIKLVEADENLSERERICDEINALYRRYYKLPEKNLSDMDKYKEEYKAKLENFFENETLCLQYSRQSYNKKLKEALSRVGIVIRSDSKPELFIFEDKKNDDDVVKQYIDAIKIIFNNIINADIDIEENKTLAREVGLINYIDKLLKTLHFCVITTQDEDDAYTLFEVLNDRAYELDNLELIKNLFLKKYCNLTCNEDDDVITRHIEEIDRIWVDEVFGTGIGVKSIDLTAYLGIVFLTGNSELVIKQQKNYRKILEKKYFKKYYSDKGYYFKDIKNDILIFKLIKTLIVNYKFVFKNTYENMLKIENLNQKSITYRTLHLINALWYPGVFPAIFNMIIGSFLEKEKKYGRQEISVEHFEEYIEQIADDKDNSNDEFKEIHRCSFNIWKMIMLGKDHKISREYAKRIISKVNYHNYEVNEISINVNEIRNSKDDYINWTDTWRYSEKKDSVKLKLKLLFIDLFATESIGEKGQKEKLKVGSLQSQFNTENLQLEHLEAQRIEDENREKYFVPENNGIREDYVNGLGNMMLLDSTNNSKKSNKYLVAGMDYYDKMGKHWLIDEIYNMIQSDEYSNDVNGVRVPNEKFFNERKRRLRNYFYAIIDRKLEDTEMTIPNLDKE